MAFFSFGDDAGAGAGAGASTGSAFDFSEFGTGTTTGAGTVTAFDFGGFDLTSSDSVNQSLAAATANPPLSHGVASIRGENCGAARHEVGWTGFGCEIVLRPA